MKKRRLIPSSSPWIVPVLLICALGGCAPSLHLTNPFSESHEWVGNGLPNLMRVSDRLYRGGQPSREGLKRLKELGVKTVVNLRSSRAVKSREVEECREIGLRYEQLRMPAFRKVPEAVVERFFELVENPDTSPSSFTALRAPTAWPCSRPCTESAMITGLRTSPTRR